MVLEVALESIFAVVDVFFVSKLGAAAVAAVGLTESMLAITYAMAMGTAIAVTAVVARRWGEGDREGAGRASAQAVLIGLTMALVLGVTGVIFAEDLLRLMGADDQVVEIGLGFTRIMLGGEVTVILLFLVNGAFRGAGDAAIAMRVLWIANAVNIVLCPVLIFGLGPFPELGVTGAALATTIGRGVGAVIALRTLFGTGHRLSVRPSWLRYDREITGSIVRLAGTASLQFLIGTASWIGLVRLMATFGSTVVAGYTIAIRLVVFAIMPAWGLSNAASTMVGQALGAAKPERANQSVRVAAWINAAFLGAFGVVMFAFAPAIVGWFGSDPDVAAVAGQGLRLLVLTFPLAGFGMVYTSAFNGAGDTWTPTWLNLAIFWGFSIPVAWLLARGLELGPNAAFATVATAYALTAFAGPAVWRRGRWRTRVV